MSHRRTTLALPLLWVTLTVGGGRTRQLKYAAVLGGFASLGCGVLVCQQTESEEANVTEQQIAEYLGADARPFRQGPLSACVAFCNDVIGQSHSWAGCVPSYGSYNSAGQGDETSQGVGGEGGVSRGDPPRVVICNYQQAIGCNH